jgi:mannitol 2-dehydrogenase
MSENSSVARATQNFAPVKINQKNLASIPSNIEKPNYDRDALEVGILHMSVGGFHRSHQAVYVDNVLSQSPSNWMIAGVGMMPQDADNLSKLNAQDCLYAVLTRSPEEDNVRIVGSMKTVIHAPTETQEVINQIANPKVKILSLTVTEKGYYYNEKRDLDFTNSIIQEELKLSVPKTIYGYLTQGLQKRKNDNSGPVTIMCCDNLPGNGHITNHLLVQFIEKADSSLLAWVEKNVSFPNAMVDRITPVTTPVVQDILAEKFGLADEWPVVCEDYIQWIIEDNFIAGRPAFEKAGAQMVKDVEPYEKMKVRLLNGSHSALSYISYLMGYREVDKAMADPLISKFVRNYMDDDITPTVPSVPGIDLDAYKTKLVSRFSNPSISDKVQRLAEDGSQKMRNAMIPPLASQLEDGKSIKWIALALAAWWRYLQGTDENGAPIEVKDPMKDELMAKAASHKMDASALLSFEGLFGPDLKNNQLLVQTTNAYLADIYAIGMRKTVEKNI